MLRFCIFLLLAGIGQSGNTLWADTHTLSNLEQIAKQPTAVAEDYLRLGHAYLKENNTRKAKSAFQKAIQKGAKAPGYDGLGLTCLATHGKGLRALYWFRRALSADPTYADAQYHLGQAYLKMRPLDALDAFEKTVEINPNHANAHYCIGQQLEEKGKTDWAISAYRTQVEINASHNKAKYRLGKLLLKRNQIAEAVKIFNSLLTAGGAIEGKAYLELAMLSQSAGQIKVAQKLYETYISHLPLEEQALYRDITQIASKSELALYRDTKENERESLITRFWNRADPTPLTPENERLVEHYRRVAYARFHFADSTFPWDDRGNVYVRLGSPDHISRSDNVQAEFDPTVQNAREHFAHTYHNNRDITPGQPLFPVQAQSSWEYWVYAHLGGGAEITFITDFSNHEYRFASVPSSLSPTELIHLMATHGDLLVHQLATYNPYNTLSDLPIDFHIYPAGYRGENGKTRLELYYGLLASEALRLAPADTTQNIQLEHGIAVYDSLWNTVYTFQDKMAIPIPTQADALNGAFVPGIIPVNLPPGPYRLRFQVRDPATGKSRTYQHDIVLENYATPTHVQLSDIELAFAITPQDTPDPFVKKGLKIIPKSSRTFQKGQRAYIYFEAYHLLQNDFGQSHYSVSYTVQPFKDRDLTSRILHGLGKALRISNDEEITVAYNQMGNTADEAIYVALDLSAHEPGQYKVRVTLTDQHTEEKASRDLVFSILP